MGRIQVAGELHKVTVIQSGHNLIRVCTNCAASWQLMYHIEPGKPLETSQRVWMPIAESDEKGNIINHNADVRVCEHVDDSSVTQPAVPAQRGLAAVERVATTTQRFVPCYCKQCDGRSAHYDGSKFCHCNSCKGKRQHAA